MAGSQKIEYTGDIKGRCQGMVLKCGTSISKAPHEYGQVYCLYVPLTQDTLYLFLLAILSTASLEGKALDYV